MHGPDGLLHRPAYTFLVLERLREALRRRDVYATTSQRWADPRARLLQGEAWEAARAGVATSLGHDLDAQRELADLAADLDGAYRAVAGRIADNAAVRIEPVRMTSPFGPSVMPWIPANDATVAYS